MVRFDLSTKGQTKIKYKFPLNVFFNPPEFGECSKYANHVRVTEIIKCSHVYKAK